MKKLLLFLLISFSLLALKSSAQFNDLYDFQGTPNNGHGPRGSLIRVGNKLYGMTSQGGNGGGDIFSMDTNGAGYQEIYQVPNPGPGFDPLGSLTYVQGKLYGMMSEGGSGNAGVLFCIDTNGGNSYRDLFDFGTDPNDTTGLLPDGSLLLVGGKLYGMTPYGGFIGDGNIFSIDTDGSHYRDLFEFNGSNGEEPNGSLSISGNKLFGTTQSGGFAEVGNVFTIDINGHNFKDLYDFNGIDGSQPYCDVTVSGYKLYGMTTQGGPIIGDDNGVVFSIDTNGGAYTNLVAFNALGSNGANPYGSLLLNGQVLVGMTLNAEDGNGNLFDVDTNGSSFNNLVMFDGVTTGSAPYGNVILSNGLLYGMTSQGINGNGNVFSYNYALCVGLRDSIVTSTNVLCNGDNSGTATFGVKGGLSPYTYLWSDAGSQTTATATGLTVGTYTVTVHDNNGCGGNASVTITQPTALVIVQSSVPITLTNSQGIGTADNLQQMLVVNSSNYTSYEDAGLQNVEFSTGPGATGVILQGWIESGASNTADSTVYWVNLRSNTIIAGGTRTIYMNFMSGSIMSASGPTGEAPQLSSTYAQYDNGHIVFNNYWNFSGTSTPSGLTNTYGSGSITYNNGANIALGVAWGTYITTTAKVNAPIVVESDMAQNGDFSGGSEVALVASTSSSLRGGSTYAGFDQEANGNNFEFVYTYADGGAGYPWTPDLLGSAPNNDNYNIWSLGINSSGYLGFGDINYDSIAAPTSAATVSSFYIGLQTTLNSASFQWLRTRTYPPSAIMPSTAFGAVSSAITVTNVNCNGNSTGKATQLPATGGVLPYTYSWAPNGGSNLTASSLSAGTYTFTATDNHGCSASASVTITQPAVVAPTIASQTNLLCNGYSTGRIVSAVTGGTLPYNYIWSNGDHGSTANYLTAGSYTLTVTDKHGCSASTSTTITAPPALTASLISMTGPSCNGGNNGSITVFASGGVGAYTYDWTPNVGSNATVTGLAQRGYTVLVKDNNGCAAIVNTVLTQPAPVRASITHSGCNLTANASGGVSPYSYSWNPGAQTLASVTETNGTYTVTVTDNNGCTATASATATGCPEVLSQEPEVDKKAPDNNTGTSSTIADNISVYPNPSAGQFTVAGLEAGMIIEIYDYTGRKISSISAGNNTLQLNIGNQSNGIYLIRIISKDGTLVDQKKLIKTQ